MWLSTAYNTAAYELVEAFNITIIKILKDYLIKQKRLEQEAQQISLGSLNNNLNSYRKYASLFGLWVSSNHPLKDTNIITSCSSGNQDDRWRQRSTISPRAKSTG